MRVVRGGGWVKVVGGGGWVRVVYGCCSVRVVRGGRIQRQNMWRTKEKEKTQGEKP